MIGFSGSRFQRMALALFATGILAALAAPAAANAPFKSYQLLVFCRNSQVASATFWQDVKEESMGLKSICVGTCPGGTVPLADVLAGLPAEVSAGIRAQVEKREADAAAGKGRSLAACLNLKTPAEEKCDSKEACEALRAIESLIARYNGAAGAYFGSFADFNRVFSPQLQKLLALALSWTGTIRDIFGTVPPTNAINGQSWHMRKVPILGPQGFRSARVIARGGSPAYG